MLFQKPFYRKAAYWLTLGLLLTASIFLLFIRLGVPEIRRADEAQHGVNAYEMMQSGQYLVHTYRGEVDYWNLKPPLSFYGIMLGYKLFGFTPFGLRFYSAASMFGMMVMLALWMKKRHGSIASLISQLFLMACSIIYGEHFARFGDADALYVLFYTFSMLCMLESVRDLRWLYGSAIGFGLAFMTKSWHAALIPVTCLAFVCLNGQIRQLKGKHYALLIFFGLLPIAPWAVARMRYDGLTFFRAMLGVDVFNRATQVVEDHFGGPLYYVQYLLKEPAVILTLAFCLPVLIRKALRRSRLTCDQLGLLLWFLTPVIAYSLCASKLSWYVFPSLGALAVALGIFISRLMTQLPKGGKARIMRVSCAAVCVVLLAGLTAVNLRQVSSSLCYDLYDRVIFSAFDRERDSGRHIYIAYESQNRYRKIDHTQWLRDETLSAMLAGDLICKDGGAQAFAADPHPSYLIAHEMGLDEEALKDMELVFSWAPLRLYKNHS